MITVYWSIKSKGVKLSIVWAVSQNSHAHHKNSIKSVHTDNLSCFCHSLERKFLEGCLARCKIRDFQLLACPKAEQLCLQQQDNFECQDRLLGCGCIAARWTVSDLPHSGCRARATPGRRIITPLSSVTYLRNRFQPVIVTACPIPHPQTENNKFWYCPELFEWACPAVCPALQYQTYPQTENNKFWYCPEPFE